MQRFLATVLGVVRRTIDEHRLFGRGDRVLVAVSGGADSVGLLQILNELRERIGVDLVVGHVNHRLRAEHSVADEECAAANARRLGLPFVRADLPQGLRIGGNLEARARRLRYHALHQLAADASCTRVATGHTLDDQAETVLLKILRGTGPAGLAGIRPRREDDVVRPLVDCLRSDILGVVQGLCLPYRTDASNLDFRFRRTVVRRRILPLLSTLNPQVSRALAALAAHMRAVEPILRDWAVAELRFLSNDGRLDVGKLSMLPLDLRREAVHAWLAAAGGVAGPLTSRHVDAVLRLASRAEGSASVPLPYGLRVRRAYAYLRVERPQQTPEAPGAVPLPLGEWLDLPGGWRLRAESMTVDRAAAVLPADLWSAVLDFDQTAALRVRTSRRGERVRPLGLGGGRKLSDLFIDRKVPADERASHPVIEIDGEILWVPGVVRGASRPLTAATRMALRLSAERRR